MNLTNTQSGQIPGSGPEPFIPSKGRGWVLAALMAAIPCALAQTNEAGAPAGTNASARVESPGTNAPAVASTNSIQVTTNAAGSPETGALARLATNAPPVVLTNADGRPAWAAFKIIPDRNIFDPNRRPKRGPTPRKEAPPVRIDTFTLTGILSSDKGTFAFFDGSRSSYVKALEAGGAIADYKIAEITPPDRVQLDKAGKKTELQIGMQMRRRDEAPWELAGFAESSEGSSSGFSRDSGSSDRSDSGSGDGPRRRGRDTASTGGSDSGSGGGESDALARLLKKRQQELNNEKP